MNITSEPSNIIWKGVYILKDPFKRTLIYTVWTIFYFFSSSTTGLAEQSLQTGTSSQQASQQDSPTNLHLAVSQVNLATTTATGTSPIRLSSPNFFNFHQPPFQPQSTGQQIGAVNSGQSGALLPITAQAVGGGGDPSLPVSDSVQTTDRFVFGMHPDYRGAAPNEAATAAQVMAAVNSEQAAVNSSLMNRMDQLSR